VAAVVAVAVVAVSGGGGGDSDAVVLQLMMYFSYFPYEFKMFFESKPALKPLIFTWRLLSICRCHLAP
jgi:hypothetical protein